MIVRGFVGDLHVRCTILSTELGQGDYVEPVLGLVGL